MSNQAEILKCKKGEIIIREGENSDCAYIIESGAVEIYKSLPNGDQQFVGALGQSDIFGELGWIDGLPRSATVKALDHCKVRRLTQESFITLAQHNTQALTPILKILVSRMRSLLRLVDKLNKSGVTTKNISASNL
jgi:CRP-like cAMP-binding protein